MSINGIGQHTWSYLLIVRRLEWLAYNL
jgi:hypothetical protein